MRRYIDIDKLKEFYKPYAERKLSVPVDVILLNIDDIPTEDVQEVRHGRWIIDKEFSNIGACSICGDRWGSVDQMKYCPTCGAKMEGEEE